MRRGLDIVGVAALVAVAPRLAFVRVPFERDEGAYAYVADTIARGGLPYRDAFDHKGPAVYYLYALALKLFGHSVVAPRLLAALFLAVACLLSFVIVRALTGSRAAGGIAMALLGLASASPAYSGFDANAELFTVPLLLGAILALFDEDPGWRRHALAGLLLGAAIVIKQATLLFAVAIFAWCAIRSARRSRKSRTSGLVNALALGSAIGLPFLAWVAYFAVHGALSPFWQGFFVYNWSYLAGPTAAESLSALVHSAKTIVPLDPVPWLAGTAGLVAFFRSPAPSHHKSLLAVALAGAAASVAIGKYYYGHYFVFLVPFLTIGVALGLAQLRGRAAVTGGLLLVGLAAITTGRHLLVPSSELLRRSYGKSPFAQSVVVGDYLKKQGATTAFILGSEPQLLFYAGLRAPTRFFYTYPLVVPSTLREGFRGEVERELRRAMPELFIYVNHPTSNLDPADPFLADLSRLFSRYRLIAVSEYGSESIRDDPASLANPELANQRGAIRIYRSDARDQTR